MDKGFTSYATLRALLAGSQCTRVRSVLKCVSQCTQVSMRILESLLEENSQGVVHFF
jgi:hypothetical protein